MNMRTVALASMLIAAPTLALPHAPKIGANGGPQTDAGSYHVEIVMRGSTLQVFLRDHSDNAVRTDGYKGIAIFVVEGKPQRIPLTPNGENRLIGTSPVAISGSPKGAVQITTPTGSTVQAKFD